MHRKSKSEAAYRPAFLFKRTQSPVGASLLAKDVNGDACCLNERGVRTFFASRARSSRYNAGLLILLLILICPVGTLSRHHHRNGYVPQP